MNWTRLTLLVPLVLLLPACEKKAAAPQNTREQPEILTVAVAASMRYAFEEVAAAFEKKHPEVKIEPSFGASGTFFAQLTQKAPFDLFLSADTEYPEKLVKDGHAETVFPYATGQLVLWALKSANLEVALRGIDALKDPRISKISIANPDLAPYGRAARETMQHFQLDAEFSAKLVRAENVGQAAQFVQSGAAEIGLFAYSLIFTAEMNDKGDLWIVPETAHEVLTQSGVILPWTRNPDTAAAFRNFLIGPEGQTILKRHGFGSP